MTDVETPVAAAAPKEEAIAPATTNFAGESDEAAAKRAAAEKYLWYWNLSCGILHLVQAAVVLGIGVWRRKKAEPRRSVTPATEVAGHSTTEHSLHAHAQARTRTCAQAAFDFLSPPLSCHGTPCPGCPARTW